MSVALRGVLATIERFIGVDRRLRAVDRIRRSFLSPAPGGLEPLPVRAFWGLGWWKVPRPMGTITEVNPARSSVTIEAAPLPWGYPPAPFGWRWLKVLDRNAAILLPLWLYWPAYFCRYWRSIVFDPLIAVGLWAVEEPGCHYTEDGRPTLPLWLRRAWWCFLNDADTAPPPCASCWRVCDVHPPESGGGIPWCNKCVARIGARHRAAMDARAWLRNMGRMA
jgi:hypothetical protein